MNISGTQNTSRKYHPRPSELHGPTDERQSRWLKTANNIIKIRARPQGRTTAQPCGAAYAEHHNTDSRDKLLMHAIRNSQLFRFSEGALSVPP